MTSVFEIGVAKRCNVALDWIHLAYGYGPEVGPCEVPSSFEGGGEFLGQLRKRVGITVASEWPAQLASL